MTDDLSQEEISEIASDPRVQDAVMGQGGYPEATPKESLLKLFKELLGFGKDDYDAISKTGNLSQGEIGFLSLPIRNYLSLANYVEVEGWGMVAEYLRLKSNIVSGTSLSKKAALLNFMVTQKRISRTLGSPTREVKSGLFGTTEKISGVDEE